jgi:hypothetical protein
MNSPNPKKKKMNKWLLGTIIVCTLIGAFVVFVGYQAKKGLKELGSVMGSMSEQDLAMICLKAETDPALKKNMDDLKKMTPQMLDGVKKMSSGMYKYNKRQLKMCASDYKAVLAKQGNPQGTPKLNAKPLK